MDNKVPFIPFAKPMLGEEEIESVVETLRSGWLTTGPKTKRFEADFAAYVGMPHAVAVNSATAGLHLALDAIGIGPGDKVLTTPHTFTATAEVIRYMGADPVFADIEPDSLCIDPGHVAEIAARTPALKAIMPVHFAGQAADMDPLVETARRHGLKIVEDAAHALPTTYKGRTIGTIGDITVFSFYANKTITTGEGGMAVTTDEAIAKRMQAMRLHGINRDVFDRFTSQKADWYYEVVAPGFKYNLTDLASAIGIEQLKRASGFQTERQSIAQRYNAAFADLPVVCPRTVRQGETHSWHLYVLRLDLPRLAIDRNAFIDKLRSAGIGTSVHYIPLHRQPYWRDRYGLRPEQFPLSDAAYHASLSLPIWQGMSDEQIERVIAAVRSIALTHQR